MGFDLSRVRRGEALAGAGAVALLALMFVLQWYGPRAGGARPVASSDGWQAYSGWRWMALATISAALALVLFQATRRAPALPAALGVISTALALVSALWLAIHVVLDHPPHQRIGAVLALLSVIIVLIGSYRSLRQEGIAGRDEPAAIPVLKLEDLPS